MCYFLQIHLPHFVNLDYINKQHIWSWVGLRVIVSFSDIEFIDFLQEKQHRFIGGPSSGKVVNIPEKNRRQMQVCHSLIASYLLFV